jgi:site-specific DNA recombinase
VIYLRVSTNKQADKDIDPEGYSLPAQRESCYRKAEQLGVEVVDEYMDRGESAKTADRPQFQAMLARIRDDRDINYVILDKVNRFARNRRDDANILFELRRCGCQLISVKENVDETPAGTLMHGILATIAEYESRNNGAEALKGMTRKAKVGGTPGRAPIGYFNVGRRLESGGEMRTVEVDPDRAPLVQWAFEEYATGRWTLTTITEELQMRGLMALPHGRGRKPGPVQRSHVAAFLSNRYYLGYVSFNGVEYDGRHQPLVNQVLFDEVQEVFQERRLAGEKVRTHNHYLKGSVFCGRCGSRLCLTQSKGHGGTYLYFFCIGRQRKRTSCDQSFVQAHVIEAAVESYWKTVRLPQAVQDTIRNGLRVEFDRQRKHAEPEIAHARRRLQELEQERKRLARGVIDGSIPGDLARESHERLDQERVHAERVLDTVMVVWERIEGTLTQALEFIGRCDEVYRRGGTRIRRLANQTLFEKLLVQDDAVAGAILREPWATLVTTEFVEQMRSNTKNPGRLSSGRGVKTGSLVPPAGLEPAARCLEGSRSIQLSYRG